MQTGFSAGEISPLLEGRVDIEKYRFAVRRMQNMIPLVAGGTRRRSGFKFIREFSDSTQFRASLYPFQFSTTQAYMLEFGNNYMVPYRDGGPVLEAAVSVSSATNASPVDVTFAAPHGWRVGDEIFLSGFTGTWGRLNRYAIVRTVPTTSRATFEDQQGNAIDSTTWGALAGTPTGARVYKIYTPYNGAQSRSLSITQSADVLYIAHQGHWPRKLTRTGDTAWKLEEVKGQRLVTVERVITGITGSPAVVTTSAAHGYANGSQVEILAVVGMPEVNGRVFTVANVTATTFELVGVDSTGYGTYDSGGTAQALSYHGWVPVGEENRNESVTLQASAVTGAVTLTAAGGNVFTAGMVGRFLQFREIVESNHAEWAPSENMNSFIQSGAFGLGDSARYQGNAYILDNKNAVVQTGNTPPVHTRPGELADDRNWTWEYIHAGYGLVLITGFTSPTSVSAQVIRRVPVSCVATGTHRWTFGAFRDQVGTEGSSGPRAVAFFEDRLWWAGPDMDPQTLWGSITGDYEDYETLPTEDSGVSFTLNTSQVNTILWMQGASRGLVVGTEGAEYVARALNPDEGISPSNPMSFERSTSHGTRNDSNQQAKANPVTVENAILFIPYGGRRVREFIYDFGTDSYQGNDLSVLADHLLVSPLGYTEMAYAEEPDRVVWVVDDQGSLLGLTYNREQGVSGWHVHQRWDAFYDWYRNGRGCQSIAVLRNNGVDEVWAIFFTLIIGGGGAFRRTVEKLAPAWEKGDALEDAFFVDSGLTYDGAPATTIQGLHHLAGRTVQVLADGVKVPDEVVTADGEIVLGSAASKVQVGFAAPAVVETMRFEGGAQDGVSQGKIGRIRGATLRLYETAPGLEYGPEEASDMEAVEADESYDQLGTSPTLLEGDTETLPWPAGYEKAKRILMRMSDPVPWTLLAIMPLMETEDQL